MKHAYAWTLTIASVLLGLCSATPGFHPWLVVGALGAVIGISYVGVTR